ncbi:ABC transporter substrate-binding protein [Erwinia sp. S59]|uniref:ABC transporter substrate-binding protein n=1 Tax=Erwinia sp. S59 TaxID=2769340 RepID=UPI00190D75A2|nr:ABC transporter substrate-binding protein [Erwinia sp. S59]MBK0094255.1 ABC transporter substrate-binding protein [Erwinia sp. S59]
MNLQKKFYYSLVALTVCALSAGAKASPKPQEIRFGTPISGINGSKLGYGNNYSSAQIKQDFEKEFSKDNIKITWYSYKNAGPGINEALANNQLDFTLLGDLPAIIGKSRGVNTKIILSSGTNNVYLVVPIKSSANSIADLKEKKIGIFKGTIIHLQAVNVLKSLGLEERDFKEINTDSALGSVQLASGQLDGLWTTSSAAYTLVHKGIGKIIFSTRNQPELQGQVFTLVRESFAEQYPEIVQRVVNVLAGESQWASTPSNQDAVFQLWARSGYPADSFKFDYEGNDFMRAQSPILTEHEFSILDKNIKLARDLKLIKKDIDVKGWVDFSYLQQYNKIAP